MSRHWKWVAAVCCLVALSFFIGIGGLIVFGVKAMKSSPVYTDALARAESAPAVATALGTPVKDGYLFTGNISESDSSGSAHFMIPISGPKGSGVLSVSATRSLGAWHLNNLTVMIDKTQERIDLLNTNNSQN